MNGLECKYTGLGVCLDDGYLYTGWSVSIRAGC